MADGALWRVRLHDNRVVFAEQIKIGLRVRDVIQDREGRLILWTESSRSVPAEGAIVVLEPVHDDAESRSEALSNPESRGALVFNRCIGCHASGDAADGGIGPDLRGIVGRRVAAHDGFRYSEALSGLGGHWTRDTLEEFLRDPAGFAPATEMRVEGIVDASERADLLAYLETLR
jgi:cytochrome c